jgi:CheY-like chemotaxis protein
VSTRAGLWGSRVKHKVAGQRVQGQRELTGKDLHPRWRFRLPGRKVGVGIRPKVLLPWVGADAQNRVEVQGGIRIARQAFDGGLRPRVLLAEDGEQERRLLRTLLQGEGVAVVGEASNGLEAVELARELEPDVVLMDLRMPGIGGLEAARMIVDSLSFTQVIVLTAYDGPLPTRSAQDAGV